MKDFGYASGLDRPTIDNLDACMDGLFDELDTALAGIGESIDEQFAEIAESGERMKRDNTIAEFESWSPDRQRRLAKHVRALNGDYSTVSTQTVAAFAIWADDLGLEPAVLEPLLTIDELSSDVLAAPCGTVDDVVWSPLPERAVKTLRAPGAPSTVRAVGSFSVR